VNYPDWICMPCGAKYGNSVPFVASLWHHGVCGLCDQEKPVTAPSDFGHLKDGWQSLVISDQVPTNTHTAVGGDVP
jgi:hypothetical protein